jgi:hypothetical protein
MKRLHILPALAILVMPLAIGSSPLLASGGGSHEDETETTEVPQSSIPRRDRNRNSVPPTTVEAESEDSDSATPTTSEPRRRRTNTSTTTSTPSDVIVGLPITGSDDDSHDESEDESHDDSHDENKSESPEGEDNNHGSQGGNLTRNIARATTALNSLPASEARDAALEALLALQARVDAGEVIPAADVQAIFDNVAALVYIRIGGGSHRGDSPITGGVPDTQKISRMSGSVAEALRLLEGNTSDAAVAAIAALESVKATLDAGILPDHDVFEEAIELAQDALVDQPTARAAVTLAGVIAAVEASDASDEVKAQLLAVLHAAQDQVLADPTADAQQIVRAALQQVRNARIAAVVQRMIQIVERVEVAADTQGNSDALLLLAQVRSLLQPGDGSLPARDQLHNARRILLDVLDLLTPVTAPTTTIPDTSTPDTTIPDTTTPDTTIAP